MEKNIDVSIQSVSSDYIKTWNAIVNHPLQSWYWGEFRKRMNVDVVQLGVFHTKNTHTIQLVDAWQITFHTIPMTRWTIGYFPKGPFPSELMLTKLYELGKQKNTIFIQLEPNVQKSNHPLDNAAGKQSILSNQLIPSHRPLFTQNTFIVDLTRSENDLLRAMHPKTRYNIRVAARHGVTIKEDNSDLAFAAYLTLTKETTKRQGFYAHNEKYHRTMWNALKNHTAHLFTATYNNTIVTAWIIFTWKDTLYYPYGASSRLHRDVMAPYLLLWEIAKWGKIQKYKKFDLWGALPKPIDTHDSWYGFHRFKEGFNPEYVEFIGSYDLVINPFAYSFYKFGDMLRWHYLKAKTRFIQK